MITAAIKIPCHPNLVIRIIIIAVIEKGAIREVIKTWSLCLDSVVVIQKEINNST